VRICSLVPAATEVLFELGLGEQVAGVTHECDWPPEAASRPAVTASLVDTRLLDSAGIDRAVAERARRGAPLYAIDAQRWEAIDADLVVAQEVCDVCAVSAGMVRALDVEVVDYSPVTLEGIVDAVLTLGERLGATDSAAAVATRMRGRLDAVRKAVGGATARPRVFVAEWLDPPYAAGHWVPEMVWIAGGEEIAGRPGERSFRTSWPEVLQEDPELVVLAPCGYDLERTLAEASGVDLGGCAAVAVDANAHFSRPAPRVVEGVELLAHLLHPELTPNPGAVAYRIVPADLPAQR
jgi:iron complex transport system substrate-binding protein